MADKPSIKHGMDRGISFTDIKEKLLKHLERLLHRLEIEHRPKQRKILCNKICYIFIALIQLRNGSRISEACNALVEFYAADNLDEKIMVQLAKTTGMGYDRKLKKKVEKKPRYRKMQFPDWIDKEIFDQIMNEPYVSITLQSPRLEKRVLDYMRKYFLINTHTLRYAFINYMLNEKKVAMTTIAKIVGHTTVSQLVLYTQHKEADNVMDMPI